MSGSQKWLILCSSDKYMFYTQHKTDKSWYLLNTSFRSTKRTAEFLEDFVNNRNSL